MSTRQSPMTRKRPAPLQERSSKALTKSESLQTRSTHKTQEIEGNKMGRE
jgi:hypothetical protein